MGASHQLVVGQCKALPIDVVHIAVGPNTVRLLQSKYAVAPEHAFATYQPSTDAQTQALGALRHLSDGLLFNAPPSRLWLSGVPGVGKTHLANAALRATSERVGEVELAGFTYFSTLGRRTSIESEIEDSLYFGSQLGTWLHKKLKLPGVWTKNLNANARISLSWDWHAAALDNYAASEDKTAEARSFTFTAGSLRYCLHGVAPFQPYSGEMESVQVMSKAERVYCVDPDMAFLAQQIVGGALLTSSASDHPRVLVIDDLARNFDTPGALPLSWIEGFKLLISVVTERDLHVLLTSNFSLSEMLGAVAPHDHKGRTRSRIAEWDAFEIDGSDFRQRPRRATG